MKKYLIIPFAALLTMALFFSSCQKEELQSDDPEAAQSLSDAENLVDDYSDEAMYRLAEESTASGCPTITFAQPQGTYPNTITVDFGESCVGQNGRVKSGQIIIEVSGPYYAEGSVRLITPVDLKVNDWQIEGQRSVTNMGLNEDGNMYWNVVVENAKITNPDGLFASWNAERTRTLIEGADTDGCEDNVYEITGGSSGVTPKGVSFTAVITTPLIKPMTCKWPVSGIRELTAAGKDGTVIMDLGNGDCDKKATLTFPNGRVKDITLPR